MLACTDWKFYSYSLIVIIVTQYHISLFIVKLYKNCFKWLIKGTSYGLFKVRVNILGFFVHYFYMHFSVLLKVNLVYVYAFHISSTRGRLTSLNNHDIPKDPKGFDEKKCTLVFYIDAIVLHSYNVTFGNDVSLCYLSPHLFVVIHL